ncbi:hypothetical protein KW786_02910 [Candidatus Parcubacteria bacterium]|nr:hypothetical protein [Candidatus Parcubacteria bacterium]
MKLIKFIIYLEIAALLLPLIAVIFLYNLPIYLLGESVAGFGLFLWPFSLILAFILPIIAIISGFIGLTKITEPAANRAIKQAIFFGIIEILASLSLFFIFINYIASQFPLWGA